MKKLTFLLILTLLISYACSNKDKVKPSADSVITTSAFNTIDTLMEAYEQKNVDTMQNLLEPELAGLITSALLFQKADINYISRMVKIRESDVSVNLNWQGSWITEEGETVKDSGISEFKFDKNTMKLMQIDGDNPFLLSTLNIEQTDVTTQDNNSENQQESEEIIPEQQIDNEKTDIEPEQELMKKKVQSIEN